MRGEGDAGSCELPSVCSFLENDREREREISLQIRKIAGR